MLPSFPGVSFHPRPGTGCDECGTDHNKHHLHKLMVARQTNNVLAGAVGLALNAFVPVHSRGLTDALAPALAAWLNLHVDEAIREHNATPPYKPWRPSPDDLIRASNSVAKLEEQKAKYEESLAKVPEELRDAMGFAASIMGNMLDQQIESAKEAVSAIQKELEEGEGDMVG